MNPLYHKVRCLSNMFFVICHCALFVFFLLLLLFVFFLFSCLFGSLSLLHHVSVEVGGQICEFAQTRTSEDTTWNDPVVSAQKPRVGFLMSHLFRLNWTLEGFRGPFRNRGSWRCTICLFLGLFSMT